MTAMDVTRGHETTDFAAVRDPRDDLVVAAEVLRMREIEVVLAWRAGDTVAALARRNGVDPKLVIDALVADQKADLAERVEWGEVRAAQAEMMRLQIPSRAVGFVYYGVPEVVVERG
jgi:hypothetical protein